MAGLLVSVRNAEEARAAQRGGAAVIDVKEPARGALGAADHATWQQVQAAVPGSLLSAALGELMDDDIAQRAALAEGFKWVKCGLAGAVECADWPARLQAVVSHLPTGTSAVAVVYADYRYCAAPPPQAVIDVAQSLRLAGVLFDTCVKQHGGLFDWLHIDALADYCCRIRRHATARVVLAGRLTLDDIPRALALRPDLLGVRGAACDGGRGGVVGEQLVMALSSRIAQESAADERIRQTSSPVA